MRLGIATCSEKPAITAADLLAAERTGAEIIPVPWDLPNPPPVDALVIRSTWGYHHNLPRFESWLKNLKMPVLNPVPLMLGNLNKRYLLDLEKAGVPIVPTLFFREVPPRLPWKDVVLKPAVSASSHLTFRLSEGIEEAAKKILLRSEGLAQPFVKEIVEQGEISAIYHKEKGASPRLSHAIIKRPATGDFRVQAEFGGKVFPFELNEAATRFCELTLNQIRGEWLYARVDFVETAQGPLLCELELVEPYLFYDQAGADLDGFATALSSHLS